MSPTQGRVRVKGLRLITAVLACALLTSACGSTADDEAGGVATLGDGTDSSTGTEPTNASSLEAPENAEDAFALFDECMSARGFDFATSVSGGSGSISIEGIGGGGLEEDPQAFGGDIADFDFEDFETANDECGEHLANIDGGFDLSPEQEAAFEDAQLEWTKCMEEQGIEVPDFSSSGGSGGAIIIESGSIDSEDPQAGGGFVDPDFDFEEFEDAASECDHVFEEIEADFAESDQ